jgi:membrane-bound lytic murein transglycosylase A
MSSPGQRFQFFPLTLKAKALGWGFFGVGLLGAGLWGAAAVLEPWGGEGTLGFRPMSGAVPSLGVKVGGLGNPEPGPGIAQGIPQLPGDPSGSALASGTALGDPWGECGTIVNPPPALCPVPGEQVPADVGLDPQLWGQEGFQRDWLALVRSIDHSLAYLATPKAAEDYDRLALRGITRSRVQRSLQRFRHLVLKARSPQELQQQVRQEFVFYQAMGHDGRGTVDFTGYFEPTYAASLTPAPGYPYPLYRRPPDLAQWPQPHPTRRELEGADGLQGSQGALAGLELVWLRDRLEAYLVQVQGSARLQLPNGESFTVGYDGRTEYPYTSLGKALVAAGKFSLEELTLPKVLDYFRQNPQDLSLYIPVNDRFVFFRATDGQAATGSLGVPVTGDRSIATDKTLMPPGALAVFATQLPYGPQGDALSLRSVSRYVLDQDTGGAIRGAGRADIFLGTGSLAGARAGLVNHSGQLYYLLLKEP